jgi:hypothetical protein
VQALRADAVPAILLKGPVIARWLYRSGREARGYRDIDLLVPLPKALLAVEALRRLGFDDLFASAVEQGASGHARVLVRSAERPTSPDAIGSAMVAVDLHQTLHGVRASPEKVWEAIQGSAETMTILDTEIAIPGEAARTLHVALHAGAQGAYTGHPVEDLRRALDVVEEKSWWAAAELAAQLDAVPLFAAGLAMEPQGRALAKRLGIPSSGDVDSRLRAGAAPALSFGLTRLRSTEGLGAKGRLIARELVPTPEFMRIWSPLARRGPVGLALAYAYRPFWLIVKLPAAMAAVARADRGTRGR